MQTTAGALGLRPNHRGNADCALRNSFSHIYTVMLVKKSNWGHRGLPLKRLLTVITTGGRQCLLWLIIRKIWMS